MKNCGGVDFEHDQRCVWGVFGTLSTQKGLVMLDFEMARIRFFTGLARPLTGVVTGPTVGIMYTWPCSVLTMRLVLSTHPQVEASCL